MEGKVVPSSKPTIDNLGEFVRLTRELPPSHCIFKVDSFSRLRDTISVFESTEFTSAGYKWILHIYPQGNHAEGGSGHVSMYVSMVDKLKTGAFVNVALRLFIYDQIRDNYMVAQFIKEKRFSATKMSWGVSRFLSNGSLEDISNGFLINGVCIFGAEVLVLDHGHIRTPLLSLTKYDEKYTWRIEKFSELGDGPISSPMFTFGDWSWKTCLYPKGHGEDVGKRLTSRLELQNGDDLIEGSKLHLTYTFSVMLNDNVYETFGFTAKFDWFSSNKLASAFLPLTSLAYQKNYVANDVLVIRVHIKELFLLKNMEL